MYNTYNLLTKADGLLNINFLVCCHNIKAKTGDLNDFTGQRTLIRPFSLF